MTAHRVPNYKLDGFIAQLAEFDNYNSTIEGYRADNDARYSIVHWSTRILDFDIATQSITYLADWYISQTTSTLVGRILRNLPRHAVETYIANMTDKHNAKRLARMVY